mgnify:CR=1 FL=1
MGVVTPEVVRQVAHLARIRLEGESLAQLAGQLDGILEYVRRLQSVPTEHVEPTSHVLPLVNVLRADEQRASLPAGTVAGLAPSRHGQFVSVPKVIGS